MEGLPRLLKAKEIAEKIGLKPSLIIALAKEGIIPAIKLGRRYWFLEEAVREWLLSQIPSYHRDPWALDTNQPRRNPTYSTTEER